MRRMRFPIAILSGLFLVSCGGKQQKAEDLFATEVTFPNGTRIIAMPARTQLEKLQGLRYYDSLPVDRGMLFFYAEQDKHPFWTYGAKFAVDIIWMNRQHRIVEMSLETQPCPSKAAHECPNFGGLQASRFVLELRSGTARANGLKMGDQIEF